MKQIIEKHRTKLIIASPIIIVILFTSFAVYVLSLSKPTPTIPPSDKETKALKVFDNLELGARSYVIYDTNVKRIISSRNALSQLPLASLTKIMSALVALDIAPRETTIEATASDGLMHKWRLDDLLGLTLVASSNDDITAITNELTKKYNNYGEKFWYVGRMNQKANSLGLKQTFFLNESGLDINNNLSGAYGSARDVAILFDSAIQTAPDIFGTTKYNSITVMSEDGTSESVNNTNQDVSAIQGIVASKTGLTDLAGGNLAIAFDLDQRKRIIIVALGSTQIGRFSDVETLARATLAYYSKL